MQLEATDCGAACLGIVLAHHGCWISLEQLREQCHVGRDGSNLADVALAASAYGMEATGRSSPIGQLAKLPLPMILFWGFNHFVVLEGIAEDRYYLNDPAEGHRVVDGKEFDRYFTGVGLVLEPGPEFQRRGATAAGDREGAGKQSLVADSGRGDKRPRPCDRVAGRRRDSPPRVFLPHHRASPEHDSRRGLDHRGR